MLLFERATFLVICYCERKKHKDVHVSMVLLWCFFVSMLFICKQRFEKVSNIIKQFKLSCSKLAAQFQSMEVKNSQFSAFIDGFTPNTYVMVIMSDSSIRKLSCTFHINLCIFNIFLFFSICCHFAQHSQLPKALWETGRCQEFVALCKFIFQSLICRCNNWRNGVFFIHLNYFS